MNEINVTIKGWVANTPAIMQTSNGTGYTKLSVATTPRYFNFGLGKWEDAKTEWFTVPVFKEPMLTNAVNSIKKGDPIVLTGSLSTSDYKREDGSQGRVLEVHPQTISHDINFGTSQFERIKLSDSTEKSDFIDEQEDSAKVCKNSCESKKSKNSAKAES